MSNRVLSFDIEGDPGRGIAALQKIKSELEAISKIVPFDGFAQSKGLVSGSQALKGIKADATAATSAVRGMSSAFVAVGVNAKSLTGSLKAQYAETSKITTAVGRTRTEFGHVERVVKTTATHAALVKSHMTSAAQTSGLFRAGLVQSASSLSRMAISAALIANRLAAAGRTFALQFRAGSASTAQGLQGLGIGFRMSGIAVGQQLASIGSGGLAGLFGGLAGAATAGTEMGVRLISSVVGILTKMSGSVVSAILAPIGAVAEGIGAIAGTALSKTLGSTVSLVGQAASGLVSGVTNIVGEAVLQVGNLFTGVAEAARGAFTGALSAVTTLLGNMYSVVEGVVGRIAGALGTVGKAVLGIGGTLGGFAVKDFMDTESGLTKGIVLLDDKLSEGDKKNLRAWANDLHRQMPTISRDAFGSTFQRVVSTGFSGDLEGAKKATEAATRLQFAAEGGGDPADAARVIAKTFSVFHDELAKIPDPLQHISDLLFQTINVADVSLGDLTTHLGQVIGPAKALGMTFEDLLVLIGKMSRTAGVEDTFTGLRRLILEPLKMSKEANSLLAKHGIQSMTLSPEETGAIEEKQRAINEKMAEVAALEAGKRRTPEEARNLSREQRARLLDAKAAMSRAPTAFLRREAAAKIKEMEAEFARGQVTTGTPQADVTERIKALKAEIHDAKKELADFSKTAGTVANIPTFLDKIAKAGLSARELAVIFPDIRALAAAMTLGSQDPKMAAGIESSIKGSTGKTLDAVAEQADTLQVKMLQLWDAMKAPFSTTLNSMSRVFKGFIDSAIGGLTSLAKWWEKALVHPAAAGLLDNLASKFGGLFKGLFGGIEGPSQGQFWRGISTGLDAVWGLGVKVVGVFTTLAGVFRDLAASPFLAKIGAGVSSLWSWGKQTFNQLSEGDFTNVKKVGSDVADTAKGIWAGAKEFVQPLITQAGDLLTKIGDVVSRVIDGAAAGLSVVLAGIKMAGAIVLGKALAPLASAVGAAFRPYPIVPGAPGAATAGGMASQAVLSAGAGALAGGSRRVGSPGGDLGALGVPYRATGGPSIYGPGLLNRRTVYDATSATNPLRPTTKINHRAMGGLSDAYMGMPGYSAVGASYIPMSGPLVPPAYGGWQARDEYYRTRGNGMYGRPDLMGPENDRLFRGRSAMELTRYEAAAFGERLRPGTYEMSAQEAAGFNPRRDGGAVPMSEVERRAGSLTLGERMRKGFGNLGSQAGRGIRSLGRGLVSPTGGMLMGVGASMAGAYATSQGSPVLGGALQGAGMGSLGFALNPVIGAFTTAIGAAIGALGAFSAALEAGAAGRAAAAGDAAGKEAAYISDKSLSDQIDYFVNRSIMSSTDEGKAAFSGKAREIAGGGVLSAINAAGEGDLRKAISLLTELSKNPVGRSEADKIFQTRGESFDGTLSKWRTSVVESDNAIAAESAKREEAAAQIQAFLKPFAGFEQEIKAAKDEIDGFIGDGVRMGDSAGEIASVLKDHADVLRAWSKMAKDALGKVPPGAEDAAAALRGLADSAVSVAREAGFVSAEAADQARAGAAMTPDELGLGSLFGNRPPSRPDNGLFPREVNDQTDISGTLPTSFKPVVESLTSTLDGLGSAAEEATQSLSSMAKKNVTGAVNMTGGEARSLKSRLRKEAHAARNRSHEKFDQYGNKIDPFTGLPAVGDRGTGTGFRARMGDGDMGFRGPYYSSPDPKKNPNLFNVPLPMNDKFKMGVVAGASSAADLTKPTKSLNTAADNAGEAAKGVTALGNAAVRAEKATKALADATTEKFGQVNETLDEVMAAVRSLEEQVISTFSAGN